VKGNFPSCHVGRCARVAHTIGTEQKYVRYGRIFAEEPTWTLPVEYLASISLLSVVQTVDGKLKLLTAQGESVPGPILEIGNTNSRYRFSIGLRNFMNEWNVQGPAHHCAVGVGHIASKLKRLAALLGMECVQVC
jgi:hypothetical protein